MPHYILQVIIFQTFFLLVYDTLLRKETFFNWNRGYLLLTSIIAVVLPFIKIDRFKEVISQQFIIRLPEVVIGKLTPTETVQTQLGGMQSYLNWSWENVYYLGVLIAVFLLIYKIVKIIVLLYQSPKSKVGTLHIVNLNDSTTAFSFFNYIFLGTMLSEQEQETILKHEMVHVDQKHTIDLLVLEFMRIVFWFNPLIYMYQNRISILHEFIADATAVKSQDKTMYYQNLLAQVFDTKKISFINTFYKQSLIKKRIIMLQKSKSKQIKLLKYVLLIPVVVAMLAYTSSSSQNVKTQKVSKNELKEGSPIIKKVSEIKEQIQIQGNTNKKEDHGLKLLLEIVKGNTLNQNLVEAVQSYVSQKNKTPLMEKISDLFNQIQAQGQVTGEDEKALKSLLVLTSENGFNDPLIADAIEDVEVPFGVIEDVPVFPGCESLTSNEERRKCMADKISLHVNNNFNTKIGKENGLVGRQRINVIFKINRQGDIVDVKSRASHPALETEAIRVIKTLPKMIPGRQKGKAVTVPYSLPIIFQVQEKNDSQEKKDK